MLSDGIFPKLILVQCHYHVFVHIPGPTTPIYQNATLTQRLNILPIS